MKLKDKIKLTLNIFRELQKQEMIKDKESDQIKKISDMLGILQNDEKYKDDAFKFDDIFDEIIKSNGILSEKYIKIGVALERANEGLYIRGNNE
ncbi:MAG: hypothetical protein ACRDDH_00585 [Cetobacterium sp.]|uniref:hypothetical protein n=1 Tax=Cetobacterium sp. TaxID=2071632 RepID=UPI003EE6A2F8